MKSDGLEENIVEKLIHLQTVKEIIEQYGAMQFQRVPEEECEADEFAYVNSGFRINTRKLIWGYFPKQAMMSKLQAAIFDIQILPTLIKSGRKWF